MTSDTMYLSNTYFCCPRPSQNPTEALSSQARQYLYTGKVILHAVPVHCEFTEYEVVDEAIHIEQAGCNGIRHAHRRYN